MLAKLTSKNQLTLPKRVLDSLGVDSLGVDSLGVDSAGAYFEIEVEDGRLILTPTRIGAASAVRRKLEALGITETDVADAVTWARHQPR